MALMPIQYVIVGQCILQMETGYDFELSIDDDVLNLIYAGTFFGNQWLQIKRLYFLT